MEKKIIKCNGMSEVEINKLISSYVNVGWEYTGMSIGFPKDYSWIHVQWLKSEPPIYPDIKSNS